MMIKAFESFRRAYRDLPDGVQRKAGRQIRRLAEDPRHPSLQTKRIKGTRDIWEARVDLHYRMTFEIKENTIFLRGVGPHEEALRRP